MILRSTKNKTKFYSLENPPKITNNYKSNNNYEIIPLIIITILIIHYINNYYGSI
uniref:Uncharacterized protein n=1 Tax=viral metagenome TaxID=1070528 RepID=A0A6C0J6H7_9ZZZZ